MLESYHLYIVIINNKLFISDNSPYGYKKIYKTHIINKLKIIRINKWQSIKHVTSNKYTQLHIHYTGLFDI